MQHEPVRFIVGLALGVAIALLTVFNTLLVWVATGPRSLEKLTPYIEEAFEAGNSSHYRIDIGETWLLWNSWRHPLDIRLRNVSVTTAEGKAFSTFPEISLGIDLWSLPLGKVLPTSVEINHPTITLFQNEDESISFGFGEEAPEEEPEAPADDIVAESVEQITRVPIAMVAAPLLSPPSDSPLRKLRMVSIRDAEVTIGNATQEVFYEASNVEMKAERLRGGVLFVTASGRLSYEEYLSTVESEFVFDKRTSVLEGELEFSGLMPGSVTSLFKAAAPLKTINLPLTGAIKLMTDEKGGISTLRFHLQGGQGQIESEHLQAVLPVTALSLVGQANNNLTDIQIESFMLNLTQAVISGNGVVSRNSDDMAIRADLQVKDAEAGDVPLLWPPAVSPMSRDWVVSNIKVGKVPEASARININFGDLKQPVLPKEAVDAAIRVHEAKVRYLPEHPETRGVNGVVHIDGVSLAADIEAADYLKDTHLSTGKLLIADLNADNPRIRLDFTATTTAKDAVELLKLPRLKHAEHLNLRTGAAEGTATVKAGLEFDFFAPRDASGKPTGEEADIDFDITADLKDVSHPGFMEKFDIENSSGTLTVKNDDLTFKGSGTVNGAAVSAADIRYLFSPNKEGYDTFIKVQAKAPMSALPKFGYPEFPFITGRLGVDADVTLGEEKEKSDVTIDLTDAAMTVREASWGKPEKEPATLKFTAQKLGNTLSIPTFSIEGNGIQAAGSAELDEQLTGFRKIVLQKSRAGQNDIDRVNYEATADGFNLDVAGRTAVAAPWVEADSRPGKGRHFSFKNFPAVQVKMDVGRLIVGNAREMTDVKGEMVCDKRRCPSANFSGKSGDKPFSFRILKNPNGVRQVSLHAENAGAFLRALNIYDGIKDGDLSITGNFTEQEAGSVLNGKIDIIDYTVNDAPILAKILSLASLTGFIDVLQGNGIAFKRLTAPFTLTNDVITFKKGKTYGPSIGMTVEGTVTMPAVALDLEGTVVPSYTLNSVFGKLPLFGPILTGGDGQGVFAATYSVKGTEEDPKVMVNPLSILTPGFLRGLFDILDKPEEKKEPVMTQ